MQALPARNLDNREHLQKKMEGELERGLSKKQEKNAPIESNKYLKQFQLLKWFSYQSSSNSSSSRSTRILNYTGISNRLWMHGDVFLHVFKYVSCERHFIER